MNEISFYNNVFLDTSALSIVDFGQKFSNYVVDDRLYESYPPLNGKNKDSTSVHIVWKQGRRINEYTWSINSLDLVLGVIGGLSGIVWAVLSMVLGGYEAFKYQNSLIGAVYPTAPRTKQVSREVLNCERKA